MAHALYPPICDAIIVCVIVVTVKLKKFKHAIKFSGMISTYRDSWVDSFAYKSCLDLAMELLKIRWAFY